MWGRTTSGVGVESVVFVPGHPFGSGQHNPLRLDSYKDKPVYDQEVKSIEHHEDNETGQEIMDEVRIGRTGITK